MRKSDVIRFAHSDVAPDGCSDVMFAHRTEDTISLPQATSQGEADITCPQGQTSFGLPALLQVAATSHSSSSLLVKPPSSFCNGGRKRSNR